MRLIGVGGPAVMNIATGVHFWANLAPAKTALGEAAGPSAGRGRIVGELRNAPRLTVCHPLLGARSMSAGAAEASQTMRCVFVHTPQL